MRRCLFCRRWFRNKQAVRRHLGYCAVYQDADRPVRTSRHEPLVQCAACVATFGADHVEKVTDDEMHEIVNTHRACPVCRTNSWQPAGWRRVPNP